MTEIVRATDYTQEQRDLIKATFAAGTTDAEFMLFLHTTKRLQLDPFARQAFCVKRWDSAQGREVAQTQVSIDGFRVIAERSGSYEGQTAPQWCGEDGAWREVWLDRAQPPAAARVGVYRRGHREPMYGVARWQSFCQRKKDNTPGAMWARMPDIMLAKCAEAQALRKAFPQDLGGIYSEDEMEQAGNVDDGPMSAPLASYAYGNEERARAAEQAKARPTVDEAKVTADAWVNEFRAFTHVDEVTAWLPDVIGAWDASDKKHRTRVYKACLAHVEAGHVEGLSATGIAEAWGHHVKLARGELEPQETTAA